jgi:hypothetical protein
MAGDEVKGLTLKLPDDGDGDGGHSGENERQDHEAPPRPGAIRGL